eukprot:TRINITY_DN64566_c0_g1_i1.p1 TRINITY_DN64566_c0_g1~~TRINITY_DN64566_c0_g1_i1.p1  ORF type:complete len:1477 (+),score=304.47 TRINITY_DN64566_c0_g1_i1:82-4512(+)
MLARIRSSPAVAQVRANGSRRDSAALPRASPPSAGPSRRSRSRSRSLSRRKESTRSRPIATPTRALFGCARGAAPPSQPAVALAVGQPGVATDAPASMVATAPGGALLSSIFAAAAQRRSELDDRCGASCDKERSRSPAAPPPARCPSASPAPSVLKRPASAAASPRPRSTPPPSRRSGTASTPRAASAAPSDGDLQSAAKVTHVKVSTPCPPKPRKAARSVTPEPSESRADRRPRPSPTPCKKSGKCYYKTVGRVRCDRKLLEQAEMAAEKGSLSLTDTWLLWEKATDAGRVTHVERQTFEHILQDMHLSEQAKAYLVDQLRFTPDDDMHSKGMQGHDFGLMKLAEYASKDGLIDLASVRKIWDVVQSELGMTTLKRQTFEHIASNIPLTLPAQSFLQAKLAAFSGESKVAVRAGNVDSHQALHRIVRLEASRGTICLRSAKKIWQHCARLGLAYTARQAWEHIAQKYVVDHQARAYLNDRFDAMSGETAPPTSTYDWELIDKIRSAAADGSIGLNEARNMWKLSHTYQGDDETWYRTWEHVVDNIDMTTPAKRYVRGNLHEARTTEQRAAVTKQIRTRSSPSHVDVMVADGTLASSKACRDVTGERLRRSRSRNAYLQADTSSKRIGKLTPTIPAVRDNSTTIGLESSPSSLVRQSETNRGHKLGCERGVPTPRQKPDLHSSRSPSHLRSFSKPVPSSSRSPKPSRPLKPLPSSSSAARVNHGKTSTGVETKEPIQDAREPELPPAGHLRRDQATERRPTTSSETRVDSAPELRLPEAVADAAASFACGSSAETVTPRTVARPAASIVEAHAFHLQTWQELEAARADLLRQRLETEAHATQVQTRRELEAARAELLCQQHETEEARDAASAALRVAEELRNQRYQEAASAELATARTSAERAAASRHEAEACRRRATLAAAAAETRTDVGAETIAAAQGARAACVAEAEEEAAEAEAALATLETISADRLARWRAQARIVDAAAQAQQRLKEEIAEADRCATAAQQRAATQAVLSSGAFEGHMSSSTADAASDLQETRRAFAEFRAATAAERVAAAEDEAAEARRLDDDLANQELAYGQFVAAASRRGLAAERVAKEEEEAACEAQAALQRATEAAQHAASDASRRATEEVDQLNTRLAALKESCDAAEARAEENERKALDDAAVARAAASSEATAADEASLAAVCAQADVFAAKADAAEAQRSLRRRLAAAAARLTAAEADAAERLRAAEAHGERVVAEARATVEQAERSALETLQHAGVKEEEAKGELGCAGEQREVAHLARERERLAAAAAAASAAAASDELARTRADGDRLLSECARRCEMVTAEAAERLALAIVGRDQAVRSAHQEACEAQAVACEAQQNFEVVIHRAAVVHRSAQDRVAAALDEAREQAEAYERLALQRERRLKDILRESWRGHGVLLEYFDSQGKEGKAASPSDAALATALHARPVGWGTLPREARVGAYLRSCGSR